MAETYFPDLQGFYDNDKNEDESVDGLQYSSGELRSYGGSGFDSNFSITQQ